VLLNLIKNEINKKVSGPPKNPGTLRANGILTDNYLREYFNKYLPAYGYHVTSAYRSPEENSAIPGAAADSAHLYNLARDFVLLYKNTGEMVPEEKAKKIYDEFFTEWHGYTYFSSSREEDDPLGKKSYHIHGNLPREWTEKTKWIGGLIIAGALAFAGFKLWQSPAVKKFVKSFKKER
jgi:hypothetical protein